MRAEAHWMAVADAARELGVSRRTLRRYVARGLLRLRPSEASDARPRAAGTVRSEDVRALTEGQRRRRDPYGSRAPTGRPSSPAPRTNRRTYLLWTRELVRLERHLATLVLIVDTRASAPFGDAVLDAILDGAADQTVELEAVTLAAVRLLQLGRGDLNRWSEAESDQPTWARLYKVCKFLERHAEPCQELLVRAAAAHVRRLASAWGEEHYGRRWHQRLVQELAGGPNRNFARNRRR